MEIAAGLAYESRGIGEPVLFIHGGGICDADLPLMSQPALEGFRLIRYHRRGYGGSERHRGRCSFHDQAADALTLLKALGVQRAHIVSHSYGGMIGLQLVADAPEAVQSLVLSEPALGMLLPAALTEGAPAFPDVRQLAASGDLVGVVDTILCFALGPTWREDVERTIPGAPAQVNRDAPSTFPYESRMDEFQFDEATAKRITQPVLSIIGTESSPRAGQVRAFLHSLLPQTEDYDVPGANHQLHCHSPQAATLVAQGIAAFLGRHPLTP
jgi:pimeloyl-ACP methyl ester carboxylesterase